MFNQGDNAEIIIIDDAFPHPLSAFRMQEFITYLREFELIRIFVTGRSISLLGERSLGELLLDFKTKYPQFATKVEVLPPALTINTKLLYFVFLGNVYQYIDDIEKANIPFIFTLYPGGWFAINNPRSEEMLKRVSSSHCFRKVIVTQKIVYEHLLEKGYCKPEQIEFVFGVVTPLEQVEAEYSGKSRFGIDKDILDICFVAHKYTERGTDKGYDVFVEVAKELSKRYPNIRFHVVGGFDENVIDVKGIAHRMTFYGKRNMEWFDEFYRDKDIILSPNLPSAVSAGSFDGFPTGSCVDAGLRKTALFCTDELKLNTRFIDGQEIVIIPHNIGQIVETIEKYYKNPQKLKEIAENGCLKIKDVYSFKSQLLPRIKLLKEEIDHTKDSHVLFITQKNDESRTLQVSRTSFKNYLIKLDGKIRSQTSLFLFIKRHSPEFMTRVYRKIISRL